MRNINTLALPIGVGPHADLQPERPLCLESDGQWAKMVVSSDPPWYFAFE
jgi:hypothetical protein